MLYAGTETGMYISYNDGANWQPFQLNLPIVPITDLALKDNNLIVATQGRSLWIIDDLTLVHQAIAASTEDVMLFKPKETYRMAGNGRPGSLTAGANHPAGVMTYFYVKDPEDKDIRLSFVNSLNDTVMSFGTKDKKNKLRVKPGANLFTWNTRGEGAERLKGMILWWASTNAPKAVPGNYNVVLTVDGQSQSQAFTIVPDPNAETDIAGMQSQFNFITEINETVDRAHQSIKKIRNINGQLEAFQKQYKDNEQVKDLVEKAKELSTQFGEIEKALYQTKNRSGQDPLNFPIKLTNKLAHLNSLVGMDDFPPTEQDIAVKDELTAAINTELNKFDVLITQEIANFNAQFNALNLNYLFVEDE